jgi:hypothetical protein
MAFLDEEPIECGTGMDKPGNLAVLASYFMPRENPDPPPEQAFEGAVFVTSHSGTHFIPKGK